MNKLFSGVLIGALAVMTACSADTEEGSKDQDKEAEAGQQEVQLLEQGQDGVDETELTEALAQFPEEKPERLITTSVPLTEMLQLLDVTPVGVPTSTNPLPKEFESIEQIGSPMQPDLEVVTKLDADLILGAKSLQSSLDQALSGMDLPAAYLPTDSFEDLKLSFKTLGTYFDKEDEMHAVLDRLTAKENELVKEGEGKELPTVMLMIGTSDSFMVMNDKSYVGSLIKRLGAENIAATVLQAKDTYSPINMEDVVAADPDIVLVLASGDHGASEEMFEKEVENNETWKQLSAYKNDKIHILDYEVFGVTSIKNAEKALTEISKYFYGS